MIPPRLTRLKIADLVCELPDFDHLPDADYLGLRLREFAFVGDDPAEVTLEALPSGVVPDRATVRFITFDMPDWPPVPRGPTPCTRHFIQDEKGGVRVSSAFPNAYQLLVGLHLGIAQRLPQLGGVLLHASAVRARGHGFLFPGPSGAGKTTAATRFDGGTMVADERCAVVRRSSGWEVHSLPLWLDKYGVVPADRVRLDLVSIVKKSDQMVVVRLARATAAARLVETVVHHRYDAKTADQVLGALAALVQDVPCVELSYGLEHSFAHALISEATRGPSSSLTSGASP